MQKIIHVQRLQKLQCHGIPINVVCVHNIVVVHSIKAETYNPVLSEHKHIFQSMIIKASNMNW